MPLPTRDFGCFIGGGQAGSHGGNIRKLRASWQGLSRWPWSGEDVYTAILQWTHQFTLQHSVALLFLFSVCTAHILITKRCYTSHFLCGFLLTLFFFAGFFLAAALSLPHCIVMRRFLCKTKQGLTFTYTFIYTYLLTCNENGVNCFQHARVFSWACKHSWFGRFLFHPQLIDVQLNNCEAGPCHRYFFFCCKILWLFPAPLKLPKFTVTILAVSSRMKVQLTKTWAPYKPQGKRFFCTPLQIFTGNFAVDVQQPWCSCYWSKCECLMVQCTC